MRKKEQSMMKLCLNLFKKSRNSTCQIYLEESYDSEFFCKILLLSENKNILLNVLITWEHVLKKNILSADNFIRIKVNNAIKQLSLKDRKIWSNEEIDYYVIEILEKDEIDAFYLLDDIVLKNNYKNEIYIEDDRKHLIIFVIMKNQRRGHSIGLIKKVKDSFLFIIKIQIKDVLVLWLLIKIMAIFLQFIEGN